MYYYFSYIKSNASNNWNTSNSDNVIGTSNLPHSNVQNYSPVNTLINFQKVTGTESCGSINYIETCYWRLRYICVLRFIRVQIPGIYTKSWWLYAKFSVVYSKRPAFYTATLIWVRTPELCTIFPSIVGGWGILHASYVKLVGGVD